MRNAKLFIINVSILTITAILMQSIGITFSVYISNKIGAESVGLFSLIMSVYAFSITLATSGINLAATRIVSEEMAKNEKKGALKAMKQCLFYSLVLGSIAGILLFVFSEQVVSVFLHDKITTLPLKIVAFSLPFIAMSSAIHGYFSAMRKVYKTASSQVLEQIFKIVLTCFLLNLLLPKGLEYACISLVIGTSIAEAGSFLYVFILYWLDKRKHHLSTQDVGSYQKSIFGICIPIAITSYIRSGLSTLKQLIIPMRLEKSGLTCNESLAKYGLVGGMVMPILMFPSVFINSFAGLLIPEFSSIFVTKNYQRIHTLTNRIFKSTMLFSACIFGIFLNFSDELGTIIYHNAEVSHYLLLLSPLVLIMYIDTIVDGMLKGLNEQVNVMKCNILDLFVSITFIYFMLPIYSVNGYIAVIYISEILNGFISIRQLIKVTKLKIRFMDWIIKPIGACLLTRYLINFLPITFASPVMTLCVQILLFIAIYLALLFLVGCVTKKDLKL